MRDASNGWGERLIWPLDPIQGSSILGSPCPLGIPRVQPARQTFFVAAIDPGRKNDVNGSTYSVPKPCKGIFVNLCPLLGELSARISLLCRQPAKSAPIAHLFKFRTNLTSGEKSME